MKWWTSDIIQDARNKFCKNFCNVSESAENDIFEITKSIANLNN